MSETKICETCKHVDKGCYEYPCGSCRKASCWESRQAGCDFCKEGLEIQLGDCDVSITTTPVLYNGNIQVEDCLRIYINDHGDNGCKNHYELMHIEYCPVCGNKLNEL